MPLTLRSLSDNRNRARVRPVGLRIRLCVCHLAVCFDWSLLTSQRCSDPQRPFMVLKRTFVHTYVGGRKADLPREVGSSPEGKVNATAQNAGFLLNELRQECADERWKGPVDMTKVLWHTAPAAWIWNSLIKNECSH